MRWKTPVRNEAFCYPGYLFLFLIYLPQPDRIR